MKTKSILLAMCVALSVIACKPNDENIKKEITAKMGNMPGMQVSVVKGVATISGVCKDEACKESCDSIAKSVKGVKSVVNNCEIVAPITDQEAAEVKVNPDSVLNTAVGEVVKTYSGVSASVSDGVVTLTGNIKKSQLPTLNMPQKVRHYSGHFLWKEKQSMTMHLD
ncbi:BON domain-containing protein [Flavobacterium sp. KACC 22761]|uniref:BON domain-containing protein n=1 Tax=Flavobacterium sp. KACC 22761 TaxID=3092665 RepID=UPI002A751470|nr:BON domain-containing protein [Flavobacterium sp. KACC 22761]WPO78616.1 BON domain-containing protein [Flavobacterium sp. KACC 22761]